MENNALEELILANCCYSTKNRSIIGCSWEKAKFCPHACKYGLLVKSSHNHSYANFSEEEQEGNYPEIMS